MDAKRRAELWHNNAELPTINELRERLAADAALDEALDLLGELGQFVLIADAPEDVTSHAYQKILNFLDRQEARLAAKEGK